MSNINLKKCKISILHFVMHNAITLVLMDQSYMWQDKIQTRRKSITYRPKKYHIKLA